jgi:site-specific DNA-methyltransferase (adenine-specific)
MSLLYPDDFINKIICGDCLEVMKDIPDKSIDMILCDLPYGTTACKWDTIIPFEHLWEQYKRIIKNNGAIVLTASEPFASLLRCSNLKMYKYDWVWDKIKPNGHLVVKYRPMQRTEYILIFGESRIFYFPQMVLRDKAKRSREYGRTSIMGGSQTDFIGKILTDKHPQNIISVSNASQKDKLHPTQKPVALFEYLIRTYTDEGNTVLDNCIGSGTTAIACINTNRNFIGIELDPKYCEIAEERIKNIAV